MNRLPRRSSVTALLILCLSASGLRPVTPARGEAALLGTISEDTTWDADGSPYVLAGVVTVARSARLRVSPGVEVRAQPDAVLVVQGVLRVEGSAAEPVIFRATLPRERWEGIRFVGTAGMSREDSRSLISYAEVRDARSAVSATYDSPAIRDAVFTRNQRAVDLEMPAASMELQRLQFLRNGVALSGWSASSVTVTASDFYDNRRNLVAGPKRPYDCVPDDGLWAFHGNDIVRGPDDGWYSDDVVSAAGSYHSHFDIDLRYNHWNTLDGNDVEGRILDAGDVDRSWTDGLRKGIMWDPLSPVPLTPWAPPGPVAQPSNESSTHPDAGMWTYITSPRDTACRSADKVTKISGYGFGSFARVAWVDVAVKRLRGESCSWLTSRRASLRQGPCRKPVWLRAEGKRDGPRYNYRLPLARLLPRGRYVVYARSNGEPGMELARNITRFRIH